MMLQQYKSTTVEHRSQKVARDNTSWDSCNKEQGFPFDTCSPTILSFGSHATAAAAVSVKTEVQALSGPNYSASAVSVMEPKESISFQVRPVKRSYDALVPAAVPTKDHILAERKRGEKLNEHFMAHSKITPKLKKMNKASLLSDTIKYVKHLQEHVKRLEEQARKPRVQVAVLVKKSQLSPRADGSSRDECVEGLQAMLPEIKVRVSECTVLIKIQCANSKGALINALSLVESIGFTIITTNVLPFTTSQEITITAMAGEDFYLSAEEILRKINQPIKLRLRSSFI